MGWSTIATWTLAGTMVGAPADDPPRRPTRPMTTAPRLSAPWLGLQRRTGPELDLVPVPGGGYRYEDANAGFVAFVDPDGKVRFENMPAARFQSTAGDAASWMNGFVDAVQRPNGRRDRPDLDGSLGPGSVNKSMPARDDVSARAAQGMEPVAWGPYGPGPIMFGIGGSFGVRPRRRNTKAQRDFLNRTESMRDAMAIRFRSKALDDSTREIGVRVVAIWKDDTVPLSIRKRQIFELWDDADAAAGGGGPLQSKFQEATAQIRRQIEKAVRRLAPRGSDDAFTTDELEELNAGRKSTARFAPYRSSRR